MQFSSFHSVFHNFHTFIHKNIIKQIKATSEGADTSVIFFSSDLFTNKIKQ